MLWARWKNLPMSACPAEHPELDMTQSMPPIYTEAGQLYEQSGVALLFAKTLVQLLHLGTCSSSCSPVPLVCARVLPGEPISLEPSSSPAQVLQCGSKPPSLKGSRSDSFGL